jgi:AcrR family transcriptional regulator
MSYGTERHAVSASRPANRKAQIRAAATDLFLEQGYHNVSVNDVGDALGISASALYYHYRNKQDLLLHAVLAGLDTVDSLILEADNIEDALRELAALVAGPRHVLAVWDSEARHLEGPQRAALRRRETELAGHLVPLVRAARPELGADDAEIIAWAVLGVLGSRSRHRLSLSRRRDEALLYRLSWIAASCPLASIDVPDSGAAGSESAADSAARLEPGLTRPRRTQLLNQAIRLFDECGFQSVTMADIGEAAGIVASGVYRHFPSKTDILVAAMNRGVERMQSGTDRALARAKDPREALALLLSNHVDLLADGMSVVGILTHEHDQLPEKERTALRRLLADYLDVWVQVLRAVLPGRGMTELKMVIHAVHAMIYLVVRADRGAPRELIRQRLNEVGMKLLLTGPDVEGPVPAITRWRTGT